MSLQCQHASVCLPWCGMLTPEVGGVAEEQKRKSGMFSYIPGYTQ